jgi:hypothetical protein
MDFVDAPWPVLCQFLYTQWQAIRGVMELFVGVAPCLQWFIRSRPGGFLIHTPGAM